MRAAPKPQADVHARRSHEDGGEKEPCGVAVDQLVGWSLGVCGGEEECTGDEQDAAAPDEEPDLPGHPTEIGSHYSRRQLKRELSAAA